MTEPKEIAEFDATVVSDIKSFDIPKTIVGSAIGFFVWYYLNKVYPPPSIKPAESVPVASAEPEPRPVLHVNNSARKSNIIRGW